MTATATAAAATARPRAPCIPRRPSGTPPAPPRAPRASTRASSRRTRQRQRHAEGRALAALGLVADAPLMLVDDLLDDGQAEPGAVALARRGERLEHAPL